MAGVSIHIDSPDEDSHTTGEPRNIVGATRVETLNTGNNSEVSVNIKVGNLAKYKDKWSLIKKNQC